MSYLRALGIVLLLLVVLSWVIKPHLAAHEKAASVKELSSRADELKQRNEELELRVDELGAESGALGAAREQGWTRAGETRLLIPETD